MNSETATSPFPTSAGAAGTSTGTGTTGGSNAGAMGGGETVQRYAQRAHEAVDRLTQTVSAGSERVMGLQQEYGDMAREQVRANPLAAIGVSFLVGIVFSKIFLR